MPRGIYKRKSKPVKYGKPSHKRPPIIRTPEIEPASRDRRLLLPAVNAEKQRLSAWKESRRYADLMEVANALQNRGKNSPLVGFEQIAYGLRIWQILNREYVRLRDGTTETE